MTQQSSGVTSLSWRVVVRYDDVLLETDQELTFACYLRQPGATYDWHAWMLAHDNVYASLQLLYLRQPCKARFPLPVLTARRPS